MSFAIHALVAAVFLIILLLAFLLTINFHENCTRKEKINFTKFCKDIIRSHLGS